MSGTAKTADVPLAEPAERTRARGRATPVQTGAAAAAAVHYELQKVDLLLDALNQVDSDLRTATSELSTLTEALL